MKTTYQEHVVVCHVILIMLLFVLLLFSLIAYSTARNYLPISTR